jgi:hypothetical protein
MIDKDTVEGTQAFGWGERIRTSDWLIQNYSFLVAPPKVDDTAGQSPSYQALPLAVQRLIDFWTN